MITLRYIYLISINFVIRSFSSGNCLFLGLLVVFLNPYSLRTHALICYLHYAFQSQPLPCTLLILYFGTQKSSYTYSSTCFLVGLGFLYMVWGRDVISFSLRCMAVVHLPFSKEIIFCHWIEIPLCHILLCFLKHSLGFLFGSNNLFVSSSALWH